MTETKVTGHHLKIAKELLEVVWPNIDVERLNEFYAEDVVGHLNEEVFGLNEIKERMVNYGKQTKARQFRFDNHIFIEDKIIFSVHQNWLGQEDNQLYEGKVVAVYRFRGDKVSEVWFLPDSDVPGYREVSQDFMQATNYLHIDKVREDRFWEVVELYRERFELEEVELSGREKQCLYYFMNGLSAKEMAKILKISFRTVEIYLANIKQKFNCSTKGELRQRLFPTQRS